MTLVRLAVAPAAAGHAGSESWSNATANTGHLPANESYHIRYDSTMAPRSVDPCLAVNGAGIEYRELSCMYPQLDPYYLE